MRFPPASTTFLAGLSGLAVLAVVLVLTVFRGRAEAIDSIAVLPFENLTGDSEKEYVVDGVTDELIGLRHAVNTAQIIAQAAWENRRSMGAHYRE